MKIANIEAIVSWFEDEIKKDAIQVKKIIDNNSESKQGRLNNIREFYRLVWEKSKPFLISKYKHYSPSTISDICSKVDSYIDSIQKLNSDGNLVIVINGIEFDGEISTYEKYFTNTKNFKKLVRYTVKDVESNFNLDKNKNVLLFNF